MKFLFPALVVTLAACLSGCAPKTAPAVPTAPKYPSFVFPGLPQELASQEVLATRHMRAWQQLQAGDLRAAERDFKWVTAQSATYFPSQAGLGYVALARKDYEEALQDFELGLVVAPRYAPGLVGRGEALLGLGRQAEAAASFEDAVAANPGLTELRPRIDAIRFKGVEEQVALARKARDAGRLEDSAAAYQRAIATSPDSGFLYRELAGVELKLDRQEAALEHARRALGLDPSDARAHLIAGEIFESRKLYKEAIAEYEAAEAIEPSDETTTRIETARARMELAALPPEYHAIAAEPSITRAQLAALIGVRFDDLLQQMPPRQAPVMTDTRGNWAAPWILSVVRSGIMDPYPNHTFQPASVIRRSDLALALSRLLPIVAAKHPKALEAWREARPKLSDLPPGHLTYPAAALTIEAGVLDTQPGNTFEPGRVVPGAEAIQSLDRIESIGRGEAGRR